ncbi:MAG: respiratory chain complex I subunit 1 family protein [Bilophila wadsworthia]
MLDLLVGILHLVVFPGGLFALALGLFLKGCDRRVEARLQRRVGPPLIQPFLDLVKLSTGGHHPDLRARAFLAAPWSRSGSIAMCGVAAVPGVTSGLPKMGDLLVIFYLFPIPAMAIMLAGSSSGSPYGGIGFSREMIMMLAYEVPLLMIMLTVAMKVGGGSGAEFSLTKIMDYQAEHGSFGLTPVMWPAFLAWLMFLPATLGVPPFDQPEAETEILEGPLLEYSGVLLAFFHMASALKMVVALALGVVLFFPGTISDIPAVNLVWFVVKCALFMLFTLTVVKSATGRLRIEQALSFFLKYPAGLALLSLILVWIGC